MWSSWACVRTTPTTRSGSSANHVKSGRMMSTPGWSASGKARSQSTSSRAPSTSTTAQQSPCELDLVGGGVDLGRAQRPGRQAEQVHACLEQDRAGGGEQALEQLQVAQVQVEGGAVVAALERPDQLLEGRADQVGGHADDPDPANGQQRQEVLVV